MRTRRLLHLLLAAALMGCGSVKTRTHFRTGGKLLKSSSDSKKSTGWVSRVKRFCSSCLKRSDEDSCQRPLVEQFWTTYLERPDEKREVVKGLAEVAYQMGLVPKADRERALAALGCEKAEDVDHWPRDLHELKVSHKLVKLAMSADVEGRCQPKVELSRLQLLPFVKTTISILGLAADGSPTAIFTTDDGPKAYLLFRKYLIAYYAGKFVTRDGVLLSQPAIKAERGADRAAAYTTVAMEAIMDSLLETPVFYWREGSCLEEHYFNPTGAKPTTAALGVSDAEEIATDRNVTTLRIINPNVTKREAQAIQLLAAIAGSQSQHLAGIIFRKLGDVEAGVGASVHFSFGDNDTLAEVVDAAVETVVRRLVEHSAYVSFREPGEPPHLEALLAFIDRVMKDLEAAEE